MEFSAITLVLAGGMGFVFGTMVKEQHPGVALAQSSAAGQVPNDGKLRIIIFGAHPDDAEYRGAGVAMKWAKLGHHVKLVSAANGDVGHWQMAGGPLALRREKKVLAVAQRLGVTTEAVDILAVATAFRMCRKERNRTAASPFRAAFPGTYSSYQSRVYYMHPCKCGFYGDSTRECRCTPGQIQHYLGKISGPLLDRIDIHVEIPSVPFKELRGNTTAESSTEIRARVEQARTVQQARGFYNSRMPARDIRKICALDDAGERTLEMAVRRMGLSARAHDRILKVARTVADLDHSPAVSAKHLAEAVQYRSLDRNYWT